MRQVLFDTSVVIAGFLEGHSHYARARPWCEAVYKNKIAGFVSNHALAELFASLTVLPHQPGMSPSFVLKVINDFVLKKFGTIDLKTSDYKRALERAAGRQQKSGAIFDGLHVQAALKNNVKFLVTFNERDFKRLADPGEITILNPLVDQPG